MLAPPKNKGCVESILGDIWIRLRVYIGKHSAQLPTSQEWVKTILLEGNCARCRFSLGKGWGTLKVIIIVIVILIVMIKDQDRENLRMLSRDGILEF